MHLARALQWEWSIVNRKLTGHFIIELKKKRTFRKFSYRGVDLDQYVFPQALVLSVTQSRLQAHIVSMAHQD
jgi:hypothetical protein